jgi:hypothetical protein
MLSLLSLFAESPPVMRIPSCDDEPFCKRLLTS